MDYQKHYERLIARARYRRLTTYTERHHVVPKCLGGDNSLENIVRLTPEEHYVAHQLLVKLNPGNDNLVWAVICMTGGSTHGRRKSNKAYGWLRRAVSEARKRELATRPARPQTAETKEKIRQAAILRGISPEVTKQAALVNRGRPRPTEVKVKISKANKGKKPSSLAVQRTKETKTGKPLTEEHKRKIAAAGVGRKKSPETIIKLRAAVAASWQRRKETKSQNLVG